MSADISLDSVAAASARVQATTDTHAAPSNSGTVATAANASPNLPNPRLTVDPSLNRVVLEFFSSSGVLTNTIPSQQQLEAYRLAAFAGEKVSEAAGTGSA